MDFGDGNGDDVVPAWRRQMAAGRPAVFGRPGLLGHVFGRQALFAAQTVPKFGWFTAPVVRQTLQFALVSNVMGVAEAFWALPGCANVSATGLAESFLGVAWVRNGVCHGCGRGISGLCLDGQRCQSPFQRPRLPALQTSALGFRIAELEEAELSRPRKVARLTASVPSEWQGYRSIDHCLLQGVKHQLHIRPCRRIDGQLPSSAVKCLNLDFSEDE